MEFTAFPKIPRLTREIIITEKIDGTNAQVFIQHSEERVPDAYDMPVEYRDQLYFMRAGSRNRWIAPGKDTDNAGFAAWVMENGQELVELGPGHHFGEWWGAGIQRRYGQTEKHFSLFDVKRWKNRGDEENAQLYGFCDAPACCRVVPVLYRGAFDQVNVEGVMMCLQVAGSEAAPGFPDPEGIIVYHTASRQLFKKTFKGDDTGKEQAAA